MGAEGGGSTSGDWQRGANWEGGREDETRTCPRGGDGGCGEGRAVNVKGVDRNSVALSNEGNRERPAQWGAGQGGGLDFNRAAAAIAG